MSNSAFKKGIENGALTITSPVIVANTAKVSNATHTGEVTGSTTLTVNPTAVSNKTSKTTLAGTEEVLINDAGTLKKTTAQGIADLGGGDMPVPQGIRLVTGSGNTDPYPIFTDDIDVLFQTNVADSLFAQNN